MRTLSRFLVLLLCLELIVSPIAPNISIAIKNANAESCPTGFTFDSTLNRCLTKTETANVMNATMSCAADDKDCYKENAKKAFMEDGSAPDRPKDGGFVSTIANIAAVAGPVTIGVMALSDKKSMCMSTAHYAMIAGGLAVVVGDNLANMQHKSRLKKIQEEWGKTVNPEQANGDKDKEREASIESQSQAFEMLAQAEESLAKAAKMKKMLFMVATGAFGVSAALSGMEILRENSLTKAAVGASNAAKTACETAKANALTAQSAGAATQLGFSVSASAGVKTNAEASKQSETSFPAGTADIAGGTALKGATSALGFLQQDLTTTQAAAATAVPPANAPLLARVALLQTAITSAQACKTATTTQKAVTEKLLANKVKDTCTDPQITTYSPKKQQSIFSYYTERNQLNIKEEIQFKYNLKTSKDFVSFFMNQKEMGGIVTDPLNEYQAMKTELKDVQFEDNTFFDLFKKTTVAVLDRLNPIASANAREEVQDSGLSEDGGAGGGGGSTGARTGSTGTGAPQVNTNGAKEYREVTAKGLNTAGLAAGIIAGVVVAKTKLGKMLIKPEGRLAYSGVMGIMTYTMMQHAGKMAEACEKRAELLRKMRDEFKSASGAVYACKSEDRNDPAKPNCYCYTPENQRNPNRGSSQICQKLWAGVNTKINNLTAATQSRVCVNSNRQADPACSCKKSNTCMKVKLSGVGGLDMGSMSVLGNGLAPVNGILGGSIDPAELNPATLGNNAAKVAAINKQLERNPAIARAKNGKEALEIKKALESGAAALGSGNFLGSSSGSGMPSNPGDAARMLEKELNADIPAPIAIAPDNFVAPAAPAQENLEFGMTGDQLADQEGQIAEVMNKDLDYGGNDINQGSNSNIFEVLSNRYQRSGMRRLFDEKGETKPDAAATTDISQ